MSVPLVLEDALASILQATQLLTACKTDFENPGPSDGNRHSETDGETKSGPPAGTFELKRLLQQLGGTAVRVLITAELGVRQHQQRSDGYARGETKTWGDEDDERCAAQKTRDAEDSDEDDEVVMRVLDDADADGDARSSASAWSRREEEEEEEEEDGEAPEMEEMYTLDEEATRVEKQVLEQRGTAPSSPRAGRAEEGAATVETAASSSSSVAPEPAPEPEPEEPTMEVVSYLDDAVVDFLCGGFAAFERVLGTGTGGVERSALEAESSRPWSRTSRAPARSSAAAKTRETARRTTVLRVRAVRRFELQRVSSVEFSAVVRSRAPAVVAGLLGSSGARLAARLQAFRLETFCTLVGAHHRLALRLPNKTQLRERDGEWRHAPVKRAASQLVRD